MVKKQKKQIKLCFSFAPGSSIENDLVDWLEAEKCSSGKEKVVQAIRGFWRAIAAMELGRTIEEVRILGLNCCRELENQSNYLRAVLSLDHLRMESNYAVEQFDYPKTQKRDNAKKETPWTFTYRPFESSKDFELVSWLNRSQENKRKIIQALIAYWLALAVADKESLNPKQIMKLGLNCCTMLENQSDYIRAVLGLPSRSVVTVVGSQQDKGASVPEGTVLGGASKTEKVIEKKIEEEYENNREIERDFLKFE